MVTRIHKFRVSWMQKRVEPAGNRLMDLFERRDVACCAVSQSQALERARVPVGALGLRVVREGK